MMYKNKQQYRYTSEAMVAEVEASDSSTDGPQPRHDDDTIPPEAARVGADGIQRTI